MCTQRAAFSAPAPVLPCSLSGSVSSFAGIAVQDPSLHESPGRQKEMGKLRQRQERSIEVRSTVPEAGKGVSYTLAHMELGTGPQTAPWQFSGCSSTPGTCTLNPAGCQPLGIPVGYNAMPPCHSISGLCGFTDTPGTLKGQLQPQGRVFLLLQPCPFPVIFSHSFSAFLPLHD